MATEAKLVISAETAGAISELLKLAEAQVKLQANAKDLAQTHSSHLNPSMEKTAEIIKDIATEAAACITSFFGWESIKQMLDSVQESAQKALEAITKLHDQGASASSLAPYRDNIALFDSQNLLWGREYLQQPDVISKVRGLAFKGNPNADRATLDATSRTALEFSKTMGVSPTDEMSAENELHQTFGNLNQKAIQGLILNARDRAGMDPSEITPVMQKLSPTVQQLGIGPEQTMAMIELFAQRGGAQGPMAKGITSLLGKIPTLEKDGFIKPGSTAEEALNQLLTMQGQDPARFAQAEQAEGERLAPVLSLWGSHQDAYKTLIAQNRAAESGKGVEEFETKIEGDPTVQLADKAWRSDYDKEHAPAYGSTPKTLDLAERRRREDAALEYERTNGGGSVLKEMVYKLQKYGLWIERIGDTDLNPRVQRRHQYLLNEYDEMERLQAHPNDGLPGFAPAVHPTTLPSTSANPGSPSRAGIIAGGGGSDAVVAAAKQAADASAQLFTALANERRPTTRPAPHAPGGFLGPQ